MSIPMIQKGLERLEALIAESQGQMKRMEEFMRSSRGESNSKFEALMEDQNAKFANLKTELSAMRTDMNGMKTGMTQRMDSIDKKITTLEINFKKLDDGLRQG
jgi:SMC interacting uncharacterized protein involved in chromosome segregation